MIEVMYHLLALNESPNYWHSEQGNASDSSGHCLLFTVNEQGEWAPFWFTQGSQVGVSTIGICMRILKQLQHTASFHLSANVMSARLTVCLKCHLWNGLTRGVERIHSVYQIKSKQESYINTGIIKKKGKLKLHIQCWSSPSELIIKSISYNDFQF